jgi:hypothetical protein
LIKWIVWFKELNSRRRVYVEIPKPLRVEALAEGFDIILATPEKTGHLQRLHIPAIPG